MVEVFNARVNLVGHREAGKTSLANRLLGNEFREDVQSTENISVHFVKSKFKKNEMYSENWIEKTLDKSNFLEDFSPTVLAKIKSISTKLRKISSIPWQKLQAPTKVITNRSSSSNISDMLNKQMPEEEKSDDLDNQSGSTSEAQVNYEQKIANRNIRTADDNIEEMEIIQDKLKVGTNEETDTDTELSNQRDQRTNEIPADNDILSEPKSDDISISLHTDEKDDTDHRINPLGKESLETEGTVLTNEYPQTKEKQEDTQLDPEESREQHHEDHQRSSLKDEDTELTVETLVTKQLMVQTLETTRASKEDEKSFTENECTKKEDRDHEKTFMAKESEEAIPFSTTLWDLGGQNEFVVTHNLFRDAESPTLMDITKPLHEQIDTNPKMDFPNTPAEVLHYWLNSLHVQSDQKQLHPNVALVLMHKDMIKGDNIETHVKAYIDDILTTVQGNCYANFITKDNIYIVSNKSYNENEFQDLRNNLLQYFSQQSSWGKQMPLKWIKLKAYMIEKTRKEGKGYMTLSSVSSQAKKYGMNDNEIEAFLMIQNSIGDFIYYSDPELREHIITDPKWLVQKVTAFTSHFKFLEKQGFKYETFNDDKCSHVTTELLNQMWKGIEVEFLKQFFQKVNLIIPMDELSLMYIIPHMLPQETRNSQQGLSVEHVKIYHTCHSPKLGNTFQIGTFHQLMSECSKIKQWRLSSNEKPFTFTEAIYELKKEVKIVLTLVKHNLLQVSIWCSQNAWKEDVFQLVTLSRDARHILSTKLDKLGFAQADTYYGICPNSIVSDITPCLVHVKEYQHLSPNKFSYWCIKKKCDLHQKILQQTAVPSLFMLSTG